MWNYTKGNADMFEGAPEWATVAYGNNPENVQGWAEKWEKGARWASQTSPGHYYDHGHGLYGNMSFYRVIGQRVPAADIDDDALFQRGLKLVVINNTNEIHHYFDIGDEVVLKRVLPNGNIVCEAMKDGSILEQTMKKHQVVLANPDLTPCQQFGWKVGDTFRIKSTNGHFNVNSIVKLAEDDGSWRPAFIGSGICRHISIEHVECVQETKPDEWEVGQKFEIIGNSDECSHNFPHGAIVTLCEDIPGYITAENRRFLGIANNGLHCGQWVSVSDVRPLVANAEPIKTPAQERGIKVGTSVIVIDPDSQYGLGAVAVMVEDDGSAYPWFDVVDVDGQEFKRVSLWLGRVCHTNNKTLAAVAKASLSINAFRLAKLQKEVAMQQLEAIVAE